jgi:fructokinase
MNNRLWIKKRSSNIVCVGMGLVALDVVINDNPGQKPQISAGGSCANVLTILSFLGWRAYPIARLKKDKAAQLILDDLKRWKVKNKFIQRDKAGSTPVIVERITKSKNGTPRHRFEWNCPKCGSWFQSYKPFLSREVEGVVGKLPNPKMFFFDRVSRSTLELAKECKNRGALIVFEPSGVKDKNLFRDCLRVAHILKYSHEKLGNAKELLQHSIVPLEIETLGSAGLRYKLRNGNKGIRVKETLKAFEVESLADSAGAGDWCTAGIVHALGRGGARSFEKSTVADIEDALVFGQSLAALNCQFEGARGGMYNLTKARFESMLKEIRQGSKQPIVTDNSLDYLSARLFNLICQSCKEKAENN